MKRRSFAAALGGAGLLIAGAVVPAGAAEHPPFVPTRDVSVTYQVEADGMPGGMGPQDVKVFYSTAAARARIERAEGPGYLIVDRAAGRATMVMEPLQSYFEIPFNDRTGAGLLLDDRMRFTRGGTDHVVGLACTMWDVVSDKTTARLCITEDGVILSGNGRDSQRGAGRMTATAVRYAALPASLFTPPAGFHHIELPAGAGAASPRRPPG